MGHSASTMSRDAPGAFQPTDNVNTPSKADEPHNHVPLLRSWRNAYLVVVVVFVLEISFFYFFSRYFS